ncbi:hypothetical protein SMICM304S_10400 [Streptomyces microflavus]
MLVVGAVAVLLLTYFLFVNGVRMLRKEGRSPSNLLSLAAALAIVGVVALLVAAVVVRTPVLTGVATAAGRRRTTLGPVPVLRLLRVLDRGAAGSPQGRLVAVLSAGAHRRLNRSAAPGGG